MEVKKGRISWKQEAERLEEKYDTLNRSVIYMDEELRRRGKVIEELTDENVRLRTEVGRLSERSLIDRILNR